MKIDRELDKAFRVTVTEKEAEFLCDASQINFERSKQIVIRLGSSLLDFMQASLCNPHAVHPSLTLDL